MAPGWCLGSGELCFSRGPQDLFPLTTGYCKLFSSHCSEQKQLSLTPVTHLEHSTCEKCADPLPPCFQLGISTPAVQAWARAAATRTPLTPGFPMCTLFILGSREGPQGVLVLIREAMGPLIPACTQGAETGSGLCAEFP